ncbi:B-type cyclin [Entomophthora muscae]|uniref:B-type cyclin n=1 Tax=Entomophthora muscae TaxID=34485 RepID=A0ACC2UQE8_9FUNG|nr:B-type cyclin [Entomophthora muscae]
MGKYQSRTHREEPEKKTCAIPEGDRYDDRASPKSDKTLVDVSNRTNTFSVKMAPLTMKDTHSVVFQGRPSIDKTSVTETCRNTSSDLSTASIPNVKHIQFDKVAFATSPRIICSPVAEPKSCGDANVLHSPDGSSSEEDAIYETPKDKIKNRGYWNERPHWVTAPENSAQEQPAKKIKRSSNQPREFFLNPNYTPHASELLDPDLDPEKDENVDFDLLEDGVTMDVDHEYLQDHLNALLAREKDFAVNRDYIKGHGDFTWSERLCTVNWMIKLSYLLKLPPTAIHLAVNIFDRYLSISSIQKATLELIAVASLSLASKHETAHHPYPRELLVRSKVSMTKPELVAWEMKITMALDFRFAYPNPLTFVRHASLADGLNLRTRLMARFFLETFLLDVYFCQFRPSVLASFAFYVSLKALGRGGWEVKFERFTGCSRADLCRSAMTMLKYLANMLKQKAAPAIHYGSQEFHGISVVGMQWVQKVHGHQPK